MRNLLYSLALALSVLTGGKACLQFVATVPATSASVPIAVASVGQGEQHSSSAATSITTGVGTDAIAFSCASGNAALVAFGRPSSGISATVTDSASNSGWATYPGTAATYTAWYANTNLASSVTSVTITYASTIGASWVGAICISSSTHHTDFNAVSNNNFTSGTSFVTGTYTTTAANEVVCTAEGNGAPTLMTTPTTGGAVLELNTYIINGPTYYTASGVICSTYTSIQTGVTQGASLGSSTNGQITTAGIY